MEDQKNININTQLIEVKAVVALVIISLSRASRAVSCWEAVIRLHLRRTMALSTMKSLILLALLHQGLQVHGHPTSAVNPKPWSNIVRRTLDLNKLRLSQTATYVDASAAASGPTVKLSRRDTYLDTATELVRRVAPEATFRVVGDHYIGTNGVAHVNFKQTAHGIDIDNADFNVNVSFYSRMGFRQVTTHKSALSRSARMELCSLMETVFTQEVSQPLTLSVDETSITQLRRFAVRWMCSNFRFEPTACRQLPRRGLRATLWRAHPVLPRPHRQSWCTWSRVTAPWRFPGESRQMS